MAEHLPKVSHSQWIALSLETSGSCYQPVVPTHLDLTSGSLSPHYSPFSAFWIYLGSLLCIPSGLSPLRCFPSWHLLVLKTSFVFWLTHPTCNNSLVITGGTHLSLHPSTGVYLRLRPMSICTSRSSCCFFSVNIPWNCPNESTCIVYTTEISYIWFLNHKRNSHEILANNLYVNLAQRLEKVG